uniref:GDNF/GAS1 domain-containing protein n=1 Tax=Oryzias melastigma TaxID=30732 RepID=A0A3B3CIM0_ORYME
MYLTGCHIWFCLLPGVLPSSGHMFPFPPSASDCVEAHRVCLADPQCVALYRGLELCAADAALSPLGEQVASECLERQDALLAKHPSLLTCKCQRGSRKEERCLRIYWRVRLLPGRHSRLVCDINVCKCQQACLRFGVL